MYLIDISEPGNFHEHSEHDVKAPPHIWTVFRPRRAVLQWQSKFHISTGLADFVEWDGEEREWTTKVSFKRNKCCTFLLAHLLKSVSPHWKQMRLRR
jgi:hypothetical protein